MKNEWTVSKSLSYFVSFFPLEFLWVYLLKKSLSEAHNFCEEEKQCKRINQCQMCQMSGVIRINEY